MVEGFWSPLAIPYLAGLVTSWIMEALLRPRPVPPWRRPAAALAMHTGIWTGVFAIELALFQRPYFAMANVLVLQLVIVLVNLAKYQALREPFIFQDFEYFTDAIRYPRLYLPFMGVWKVCLSVVAAVVVFGVGLLLEDPIIIGAAIPTTGTEAGGGGSSSISLSEFLAATSMMAVLGALITWLGGRCEVMTSFLPANDLERLGLFPCLWLYAVYERKPVLESIKDAPFSVQRPLVSGKTLPHLIVIQSESFFDLRREYPEVRASILRHFDSLCVESIQYGELEVAARGANTIRSEFAFLSGLTPETIGVHQFNPYRRLARSGEIHTLASYLRLRGYRTICIHPYHSHFYGRDKVLPLLGFDEFIDLSQFTEAPRFGPYVADAALADRAIQLLHEGACQPLYIQLITMENHGPLHWESVDERDRHDVLRTHVPPGCDELVAYGRHLKNADTMFRRVADALQMSGPAGSTLCIYGDHVPIMSQAYRCLREPNGTSDYVIWKAGGPGAASNVSLKISDLAPILLKTMGI